jgi:hypothetical protein
MTIDGTSFLVHCSIWTRCFHDIQSLIFTFKAWNSLRVRSQQLAREDSSVIYLKYSAMMVGPRGDLISRRKEMKRLLLVHDICSLCMCSLLSSDVYVGWSRMLLMLQIRARTPQLFT